MINRKSQLKFLLILLAGALLLASFIFSPFLAPLSLAAVFAVVLQPLYIKILRKFGDRASLAALVAVLIAVICILVPLTLIGTQIFGEAGQLYSSLADSNNQTNLIATTVQDLGQWFANIYPGSETFFNNLSADLDVYAKRGLEWLLGHLGAALSSVSALLLDLFIFFVALYYLLRDGQQLKQELISLSPLEDKDDEIVFGNLESAVNSVVKGSLTIALIQGALTAIGFTIFGVPSGVLWGTVAAVAALIPAVGTSLVILPAIIYLFLSGHTAPAVGLLIWGALAVGLVDNLLGPKLMGKGMRLHPLLVLLSVLGGIAFFGPIGIFLGPLTLSLLFAFIKIYSYLAKPLIEAGE
jgi:predicted PurR-regulated permease PerM